MTQLHCVALALPLQTARLEVRLCQQPPDLFKNQDLASFFSGSAVLATLTIPYELALTNVFKGLKKHREEDFDTESEPGYAFRF